LEYITLGEFFDVMLCPEVVDTVSEAIRRDKVV
jgi:hypothetical protein